MRDKLIFNFLIVFFLFTALPLNSQIIIDHTNTDITRIPVSAINKAISDLHIAYGHTSHGSQITDGMTGLVEFANNGGKGLSHQDNIFAWNKGGIDGALDLHDYAMGGDCGYYPQWVNNTVSYLGTVNSTTGRGTHHSDVNVIIWSWCGQVDDKYAVGALDSEYLTPMSNLGVEYFGVTFVYMTGHVDHWDDADNKAANQMVRNYCIANNKMLYDFADIEFYDPDGAYYEFPHDNCDYYESAQGTLLGNWAVEWQDLHTEGVDWYNCGHAHTQPLNSNQKAYAVWWLWAVLAGWDGSTDIEDIGSFISLEKFQLKQNFPNPFNPVTNISYVLPEKKHVCVQIYNLKGERVKRLVDKVQQAGTHSITWTGQDSKGMKVGSGIYIYCLETDNNRIARKMTLIE